MIWNKIVRNIDILTKLFISTFYNLMTECMHKLLLLILFFSDKNIFIVYFYLNILKRLTIENYENISKNRIYYISLKDKINEISLVNEFSTFIILLFILYIGFYFLFFYFFIYLFYSKYEDYKLFIISILVLYYFEYCIKMIDLLLSSFKETKKYTKVFNLTINIFMNFFIWYFKNSITINKILIFILIKILITFIGFYFIYHKINLFKLNYSIFKINYIQFFKVIININKVLIEFFKNNYFIIEIFIIYYFKNFITKQTIPSKEKYWLILLYIFNDFFEKINNGYRYWFFEKLKIFIDKRDFYSFLIEKKFYFKIVIFYSFLYGVVFYYFYIIYFKNENDYHSIILVFNIFRIISLSCFIYNFNILTNINDSYYSLYISIIIINISGFILNIVFVLILNLSVKGFVFALFFNEIFSYSYLNTKIIEYLNKYLVKNYKGNKEDKLEILLK